MSFYRETMVYLHKLIYLRPHGNIEGAVPGLKTTPQERPVKRIRDAAFCSSRFIQHQIGKINGCSSDFRLHPDGSKLCR